MIEAIRSEKGRPTIFLLDGKPCLGREVAKHLGITLDALNKRVRRGTSLEKCRQPRYVDREVHALGTRKLARLKPRRAEGQRTE